MTLWRKQMIAACFALHGTGLASAQDVSAQLEALRRANEELAAKVGRLEAEVAAQDPKTRWLDEARASEIRSIVEDALLDASTRTSLAADGSTAGWDKSKGFFIASADGNYSLSIKGDIQARWAYDSRDIGSSTAAQGSPSNTTPEDVWGFEIRRMRLTFFGTVIDPSWYYEVKFNFARSGGQATLDDAFIEKRFEHGISLRAGQFKAPFLRETIISATSLLAVERSLVDSFFTTGRPQGLRLSWETDDFRLDGFYGSELAAAGSAPYSLNGTTAGPLNAGAALGLPGSQNTGFSAVQTDYAFMGRAEWKPAGSWKQFRDQQSYRGEESGLLLGVAAYVQQVAPITGTDGATPDVMWSITGDATIDFGGANLFLAGVLRNVSLQEAQATRSGDDENSLSQWGALIQGGYFITDDVELFARYELGNSDTDKFRTQPTALEADGDSLNLATFGANWWPAGSKNRAIKVSTDAGYAFDPLVDFANSGANYLPDYTAANGMTNDGQWVFRTQLQIVF